MTMFSLPLSSHPEPSREPFSRQTAAKASRLRGATVTEGLCPYCAVGCGQLIYTKGGKIIDIEGNPESPINEGTLCPKGANAFQLAVNPHRVTQVLYRAPFSDQWEARPLAWALDRIAHLVKEARDADFTARNEQGRLLNSVRSIGTLGGATIDNEENYLIKKLFGGGLGVVSIENQARI
jgi:formate dehydrogenase major subunit